MKLFKHLKTSLLAIAFISFGAIAQDTNPQPAEVSDEELTNFASAYTEIQEISMQTQQDMAKTVEESGFEIERFNTIYASSQNPQAKVDATDEEMKNFKKVMGEIEVIQQDMQKQTETVITKKKLTVARYQEVISAAQTDTELQKRLQEKLQ